MDDGGTDSFWRGFHYEGGVQGRRPMWEPSAQRERSRTRERIMNRLFISFSSVKLLRMARPREPRFLFHRRVMYCTSRVPRVGIPLVSSL